MSDVSKTNAELIAETIRRVDGNHTMGAGELSEQIAAALESATRVPEQGEASDDRETFEKRAMRQRTELADPHPWILRIRQCFIDGGGTPRAFDACINQYVATAINRDGAPEWEYSVGFDDPGHGWTSDIAEIHDEQEDAEEDYRKSYGSWLAGDQIVRRRKAGLWLPVEGESE